MPESALESGSASESGIGLCSDSIPAHGTTADAPSAADASMADDAAAVAPVAAHTAVLASAVKVGAGDSDPAVSNKVAEPSAASKAEGPASSADPIPAPTDSEGESGARTDVFDSLDRSSTPPVSSDQSGSDMEAESLPSRASSVSPPIEAQGAPAAPVMQGSGSDTEPEPKPEPEPAVVPEASLEMTEGERGEAEATGPGPSSSQLRASSSTGSLQSSGSSGGGSSSSSMPRRDSQSSLYSSGGEDSGKGLTTWKGGKKKKAKKKKSGKVAAEPAREEVKADGCKGGGETNSNDAPVKDITSLSTSQTGEGGEHYSSTSGKEEVGKADGKVGGNQPVSGGSSSEAREGVAAPKLIERMQGLRDTLSPSQHFKETVQDVLMEIGSLFDFRDKEGNEEASKVSRKKVAGMDGWDIDDV